MSSNQSFTPFRSGCGMCKPSTDYYKTQNAGGNYSNDGLIPVSNGKNFYKEHNFNMGLNSNFIKNNKGIDYATSFGGKKPTKKQLPKKIKGGNFTEYASVHEEGGEGIKGNLITSDYSPLKGGKKKNIKGGYEVVQEEQHQDLLKLMTKGGYKKKNIKGGYEVVQEEQHQDLLKLMKIGGKKKNIKGGYGTVQEEQPHDLVRLISKGGYKKKNIKGGEYAQVHEENGENIAGNLITSNYSPLKGGKKKSMKGGEYAQVHEENGEGIVGNLITSNYSPLKGGKKKSMKGGMESSGATPLPLRFHNPSAHLDNYPATPGNGVMSAYGKIESGNVGTGMLAPYTSSTCSYANPNTNLKTGGAKKKQEKTKEKPKKPTKSKKQKGGMESSGATPLPLRFYKPDSPIDNYSAKSGNGIMSAYGPIKSGDIGTGMLAPYTSSTCSYANYSTDMKTGGKKVKVQKKKITALPKTKKITQSKKKIQLKGGRINPIHDDMIVSVQTGINGAIDGFSKFMGKLNEGYLKSVKSAESVKIGNQRLIKGGKKESITKKQAKKPSKKEILKKPSKKQIKKGGNGSDYASTQNSRGPVNAPDDYWGVPGEQWFRQFNKSGDYIPNSQLARATTPALAGIGKNDYVMGYNEMELAGKY